MKKTGLITIGLLILVGALAWPSIGNFLRLGRKALIGPTLAESKAANQRAMEQLMSQDQAPVRTDPVAQPKKPVAPTELSKEEKDARIRLEALDHLTDQTELAKIAVHDPSLVIRKAAVRRLDLTKQTDPILMERLLLSSDNEKIQEVAANRIPAARKVQHERRMAVFSDSAALTAAAISHPEPVIRHAAVARLQDPAALSKIAMEAPDLGVRRAAAARIPDAEQRQRLMASIIPASISSSEIVSSGEAANNSSTTASPSPGREMSVDLGNLSTVALVWIPPTSRKGFLMGSPDSEADRDVRERRRTVVLTKGFWLGKTEVTRGQWAAVMSRGSVSKFSELPEAYVSWNGATEFCQKLTEKEREARRLPEGYEYTLPTEAQWEYACRAGTTGAYAGDLDAMAWYGLGDDERAHEVGTKQPNAWGLYDMHGNLWEWCRNWGDDDLAQANAIDPIGPSTGTYRAYRGGCWNFTAGHCRSAGLGGEYPGETNERLGFRLALAPVPAPWLLETGPAPSVATESAETVPPSPVALPEATPPAAPSPAIFGDPPTESDRDGQVMTAEFGRGASSVLVWVGPTFDNFKMGSHPANPQREEDQKYHAVILTKGFWLGQTEVTQALWKSVMGKNPSVFSGNNLPVENITWNDAMEFCRKLTEQERAAERLTEAYAYTLPTEAQWEYACRSNNNGNFANESSGLPGSPRSDISAMAWYADNAEGSTHPVATRTPNQWNLADMHGNVAEWCRDWYGEYPGGIATDPSGPSTGKRRIYRGGSWRFEAKNCFSAMRRASQPGFHDSGLGFRLALVPMSDDLRAATAPDPNAAAMATPIPEGAAKHGPVPGVPSTNDAPASPSASASDDNGGNDPLISDPTPVSTLERLDREQLTPMEKGLLPGEAVAVVPGIGGSVLSLAFSRNGRLAAGYDNGRVSLWDLNGAAPRKLQLQQSDGRTLRVSHLVFSSDARRLAAINSSTLVVWDMTEKGGRPFAEFSLDRVDGLAWQPGGKLLALGSNLATFVKITPTGLQAENNQLQGASSSYQFSPDGARFASIFFTPQRNGELYGSEVKIWERNGTRWLDHAMLRLESSIKTIAFSPDGRQLATGGLDKRVRFWDLTVTPAVVKASFDLPAWPARVEFTSDGTHVVAFSSGADIAIYDVAKKEIEWSWGFIPQRNSSFATGGMYSLFSGVALAPDGRHLAFSNNNAQAVVLRLPSQVVGRR